MTEKILIAGSSSDEHVYVPVGENLTRRGFDVVVYRTDQVMTGQEEFMLDVSKDGELTIAYEGKNITPGEVGAAWYRKIANFALPDVEENLSKQLYMNNEVRALHDTIWSLYPNEVWLNSPQNNAQADRKLEQLIVAREVGFSIPQTVVGNNWQGISSRLLSQDQDMVVKMMRGVIGDQNQVKGMHTTPINEQKLNKLASYTVPFPGLFQPFLDKAREWRVTAVGDSIFPAAIYTSNDAKDDWRKHQLTDSVRFESAQLPEGIDEKCMSYLARMGLKYGAFDFVENSDGEVVFLECNPNGQYGWLEEQLELPISDAIADELAKIARA